MPRAIGNHPVQLADHSRQARQKCCPWPNEGPTVVFKHFNTHSKEDNVGTVEPEPLFRKFIHNMSKLSEGLVNLPYQSFVHFSIPTSAMTKYV